MKEFQSPVLYRTPPCHMGETRHALNLLPRVKDVVGNLTCVRGMVGKHKIRWVRFEFDDRSRITLSDLNWGYAGTGPQGFAKCLEVFSKGKLSLGYASFIVQSIDGELDSFELTQSLFLDKKIPPIYQDKINDAGMRYQDVIVTLEHLASWGISKVLSELKNDNSDKQLAVHLTPSSTGKMRCRYTVVSFEKLVYTGNSLIEALKVFNAH